MATKRWSKFSFLLSTIVLYYSCTNEKSNPDLSLGGNNNVSLNDSNLVVTDSSAVFSETILFNSINYSMQTIYDYSLSYNVVRLIKNIDTIVFQKDGLYIYDSIYDINNDNKNDLNVKYQTTKGFVLYTYLFDIKRNALNVKPMELFNFTQIDNKFFFQVNKDFFIWEFKKYQWIEMGITYKNSLFLDMSKDGRYYFRIVNGDTVRVNEAGISDNDKKAINEFLCSN